jgi:hypothetical protein
MISISWFEERRQVEIRRQGIDGHGFGVRRQLDDADFRPEGRLAQEFRVDGDERMAGKAGTGFGQDGRVCNEAHWARYSRIRCRMRETLQQNRLG